MNRIAAIALFAAAVLTTVGSAAAQSRVIEVNVPFNFTVNNTFLPAGSYTFAFDPMHADVLIVRDRARNLKARDIGQRGSIGPGKADTLTFHRYGDQFFLSEVRLNSASREIFLPATKLEKQASNVSGKEDFAFVAAH